jgi:hypothetical protein
LVIVGETISEGTAPAVEPLLHAIGAGEPGERQYTTQVLGRTQKLTFANPIAYDVGTDFAVRQ